MKIILEVDNLDNAVVTGTLWELLDDLKTSEQIKDYKIEDDNEGTPIHLEYKCDDGNTWCRDVVFKTTDEHIFEEAPSNAVSVKANKIFGFGELIYRHIFTEVEREELKAR